MSTDHQVKKYDMLQIPKLDAAQRQLDCAIELWFHDKDPVSVHTLVAAAYEIVHAVMQKQPNPAELYFDTAFIKDENREEFVAFVRKPANFFKHGNRDPHATLDFHPVSSMLFVIHAEKGLRKLGKPTSYAAQALVFWLTLHEPQWIREESREALTKSLHVEEIAALRELGKAEFFKKYIESRVRLAARGT